MIKIFKKFSASLVLSMILGIPLTSATTFGDVEVSNDNYIAIEYLVSTGTLQGYSDSTFKPEQTINRAELMKVLVAGQGIDPDSSTYSNCFPDVSTDWYSKYVCYAHAQGWVDGYPDNTFKPEQTVNKVEAAKMIVNAYGFTPATEESQATSSFMFTDVSSSDWFYGYVMALTELNIVDRDSSSSYNPSDGMNRGGVAEYIFRSLVANGTDEEVYSTSTRDEFLTVQGQGALIPEGLAAITTVYYDGQVYQTESDEYVEVKNEGQGSLDLEGYWIKGSKGDETYVFPAVELAPGDTIKVYTNEGEYSFGNENALWSNDGETATLYSSDGTVVDTYTY